MVVRKGKVNDVNDIIKKLDMMKNDHAGMLEMRRTAWGIAKSHNIEIFGRRYSQIYYKAITKEPLVSVVIPTYNRIKTLQKVLGKLALALDQQTEVVIADDGSTDGTDEFVKALDLPNMTLKYVRTDLYKLTPEGYRKTYGLAHARNVGVMEAEGEYIMLLDDRIGVDPGAIKAFRERAQEKTWLWGMKDNSKKGFVENFSFIKRRDLIDIGGFPEIITQYGGMTQAVRKRAERQGIRFDFIETAKAEALEKSRSKWTRWEDIAKSKTQCYKLGYE
jgi:glycosyltransferase involved in cell wall biosynthesis